MRYFTPELFIRLQNRADSAALHDWDQASDQYSETLRQMESGFPRALRKLVDEYILHDAEVLALTRSRDNLSITLLPELDDGHLLVLTYTLVEEPRVNRSAFPDPYRTTSIGWLYDELSMGTPMPRLPSRRSREAQPSTDVPTYCHEILLSNGWELVVRFRQIKITRPGRLLPEPQISGCDSARTLSHSA